MTYQIVNDPNCTKCHYGIVPEDWDSVKNSTILAWSSVCSCAQVVEEEEEDGATVPIEEFLRKRKNRPISMSSAIKSDSKGVVDNKAKQALERAQETLKEAWDAAARHNTEEALHKLLAVTENILTELMERKG